MKKEWQEIIRLMSRANTLGYKPDDPFELLPYIEAQAAAGSIDAAEKLSAEALKLDKRINKGLCQVWKRVQAQASAGSGEEFQVHDILSKFSCQP